MSDVNNKKFKISQLQSKLLWILRALIEGKELSLHELSAQWIKEKMDDGKPLLRATFTRYRKIIMELYGIEISCRAYGSKHDKYYIRNKRDFLNGSIMRWAAFNMELNLLFEKHSKIEDLIRIEATSFPWQLDDILTCIEQKRIIVLSRVSDVSEIKDNNEIILHPYGIRCISGQWFILGRTINDNGIEITDESDCPIIQSYKIDENINIKLKDDTFKRDKRFKIHQNLNKVYARDNGYRPSRASVLDVTIAVSDSRMKDVIKVLGCYPFHIGNHKNGFRKLSLSITDEDMFVRQIIPFGKDIKIEGPCSLEQKMRGFIFNMLKFYDYEAYKMAFRI